MPNENTPPLSPSITTADLPASILCLIKEKQANSIKSNHSISATDSDPVSHVYGLLGPSALLLPIPSGSKAPRIKGWPTITWSETQTDHYQSDLRQGNIGVLVGRPSKGLCSIDCDSEAILDTFLAANPVLRNTLITRGYRGGNVWVQIIGDYPTLKKFAGGEWRSDGGQTVIWGTHPNGQAYRFLNEAAPIKVAFEDIVWPESFQFNETISHTSPHFNSSVSTETESIFSESVSLYHTVNETPILNPIAERIKLDATLDSRKREWLMNTDNHRLRDLYEVHVDRFFQANRGQRNQFIIEAAPRLYYAVAPEVALKLLLAFYDINQPVFHDPRNQHEVESRAMLVSLEKTYIGKLAPAEVEIYSALPEWAKPCFRILRDLALRDDKTSPRGTFFMSAAELARRLGLGYPMQADRILRKLRGWDIIDVLTLGEQYQLGRKAKATLYAWKVQESLNRPAIKDTVAISPFNELTATRSADDLSKN